MKKKIKEMTLHDMKLVCEQANRRCDACALRRNRYDYCFKYCKQKGLPYLMDRKSERVVSFKERMEEVK